MKSTALIARPTSTPHTLLATLLTLLCSLVILALSPAKAFGTTAQWQEKAKDFKFKETEIIKVVEKVGKMTRQNFILDPKVRGKITILPSEETTVQQAYEAFLAALSMNGYGVLDGGAYKIIRATRNIQRDNTPVYVDQLPPLKYEMVTLVYTFKHAQARDVVKQIRILPSKDGELTPFPPKNQIIMTDFAPNLHRVWKILQEIDKPTSEKSK